MRTWSRVLRRKTPRKVILTMKPTVKELITLILKVDSDRLTIRQHPSSRLRLANRQAATIRQSLPNIQVTTQPVPPNTLFRIRLPNRQIAQSRLRRAIQPNVLVMNLNVSTAQLCQPSTNLRTFRLSTRKISIGGQIQPLPPFRTHHRGQTTLRTCLGRHPNQHQTSQNSWNRVHYLCPTVSSLGGSRHNNQVQFLP